MNKNALDIHLISVPIRNVFNQYAVKFGSSWIIDASQAYYCDITEDHGPVTMIEKPIPTLAEDAATLRSEIGATGVGETATLSAGALRRVLTAVTQ